MTHCHIVKWFWMFRNAFQPRKLWYSWIHVALCLLRNITQGWVYRCVSFHCTECWGRGCQRSCCQFSSVFCIIVKWKSYYDICAPHLPINSVLLNMSCLKINLNVTCFFFNFLQFLQMTGKMWACKCDISHTEYQG